MRIAAEKDDDCLMMTLTREDGAEACIAVHESALSENAACTREALVMVLVAEIDRAMRVLAATRPRMVINSRPPPRGTLN